MGTCVDCGREHDRSSSCVTPMVADPAVKADMMKAAEAMMPALHLMYGWKLPKSASTRILTADVGTSGVCFLVSQDGREFVMGIPLAALRGGKSLAGAAVPREVTKHTLTTTAQALGFSDIATGEPMLWLIDDRKGRE